MKIVTNWVIGRLAERRFASLADLNEAIAVAVEAINDRTRFGANRSAGGSCSPSMRSRS